MFLHNALKRVDHAVKVHGFAVAAAAAAVGALCGLMVGGVLSVALFSGALIVAKMVVSRASPQFVDSKTAAAACLRIAGEWLLAITAALQLAYYLSLLLGSATFILWTLPLYFVGTVSVALVIYLAVQSQTWRSPAVRNDAVPRFVGSGI